MPSCVAAQGGQAQHRTCSYVRLLHITILVLCSDMHALHLHAWCLWAVLFGLS